MSRFLRIIPALTLFLLVPILPGCGDDSKTSTIQDTEETIKADEAGRKAMEEFIKSKGQKK